LSNTALTPQAVTMTSREIAELTGKEHRNVLRDVRAMLVELYGEGGVLKFEHAHTHPQNGQTYPIFSLPKDLTLTLVAGYNVKLRKRIIDRWIELEKSAALAAEPAPVFNIPQTYQGALRLAADLAEERDRAQVKLAQAEPKVQVYDRIIDATGMYLVRAAAKTLGVGPGKLIDWLLANDWAYRHAGKGHLLAFQDKMRRGWLAHKLTPFWNRRTQMNEVTAALRVTEQGMTELARHVSAMTAA